VVTGLAVEAGAAQQLLRKRRIAPPRRQDECPQVTAGGRLAHSPLAGGVPSSPRLIGTPRSTPWKFVSGWPTCRPPSIQNSRIVVSCLPVRFLTMEIARLTEPRSSK